MVEVIRGIGGILLCIIGISHANDQTFPLGADSQYFMTEIVRVKRQAGYVYNRPGISFDLPPKLLPSPPSTQAPTVDRTQAQMMYYAYPVPAPAPSGNPLNPGASAGANLPSTGGTSPGGTSTGGASTEDTSKGYNYSPQNTGGTQAAAGGYSQSGAGSGQASGGVTGYQYSSPTTGADTTAGGPQTSNLGSAQSSSSASSQTNTGSQASANSGSGYSYQIPNPTLQPNLQTDVSTNAPKYLPPTGSAGTEDGVSTGSAGTPPQTGPTTGGSGYGGGGGAGAPPPLITDQYLPPLTQSQTENTLQNPNANAVANAAAQTNTGSVLPNAAYIPPAPSRPSPSSDVTPRPFAPPPAPGYLPPNVNSEASSGQGSLSTPASTYLPPVL